MRLKFSEVPVLNTNAARLEFYRLRGGRCIRPAAAAVVSSLGGGVLVVGEAYWVGWAIGRTYEQRPNSQLVSLSTMK